MKGVLISLRRESEKLAIPCSQYLQLTRRRLLVSAKPEDRREVRLVRGTLVELEAVEAVSSNVLPGDAIQFRVAHPLEIEGAAPIPEDSVVTGVINEIEKCVHCGQVCGLAWSAAEISVVDGRSIPLQLLARLDGSEHRRQEELELAAASFMFPGSSLVLLLSARPKEIPVINAGQHFHALVREDVDL